MAKRHTFAIVVLLASLSAPACSAEHLAGEGEGRGTGESAMPSPLLTSGDRPIVLGADAVRVALAANGAPLKDRIARLQSGQRLSVVLRGLRAESQPGVLYHAYLDLPAGADPAKNEAHHIGVINFFAATPPAPDDPKRIAYAFDITAVARALHERGRLADRTTLTLVPAGSPQATAVVAGIDVTLQ